MEQLLRATAQAEARHFWFRGLRAFAGPFVRAAVAGRPEARILDCGCGTGANLALLGRFGRAYGFDLSELGPQIARASGLDGIVRATVTAAPFASGAFDLVTSFDVLYALDEADEAAAVAELFRLLRPGGFALVNVAAHALLAGDHSALSLERRRYTRGSLRRLLERAGFRVVRITYTNATLFAPLLVLRMLQRWRGVRAAGRELSVPAAPLNAALAGLLRMESVWLRRFDSPIGSSVLCLARKPDGGGAPR